MKADFDVLVIGRGPAGLTAAVTLAHQRHTCVVFDSKQYRNDGSANIFTILSWDNKPAEEFRNAARLNMLENYANITYQTATIVSLQKTETEAQRNTFTAVDSEGVSWFGRKVILASGCEDIFPDIPGFAEIWPTGIEEIAFCRILAVNNNAASDYILQFACGALPFASKIRVYTNGNEEVKAQTMEVIGNANQSKMIEFQTRCITRLEKTVEIKDMIVQLEDGSVIKEGFLLYYPPTKLRGPFAQQLGLELTPEGSIKTVTAFNETSVSGSFAAGDAAGTFFKITAHAIYQGSVAGAGVCVQLEADQYGQKTMGDRD